jgi:putative protease
VAASLLNRLRREAAERLQALQGDTRPGGRAAAMQGAAARAARAGEAPKTPPGTPPSIHWLVRTPGQLEAAIESRPATITLDYLDLYGLRPSLERVREAGLAARVASPRILKPGEGRIADFLLRLQCPILVRPAGLLHELAGQAGVELTGDFSLNAANSASVQAMLEMGLARITPAHDLNGEQVADLARRTGGLRIEAIAYQHLPVFHTEHCVFCRFLSSGTSYLDCGRPCEKHRVELRDAGGRRHPVLADAGCRNTVFGAEAQEASQYVESWLGAGIRDFRLEFVDETGEQAARIAAAFGDALEGRISFRQLREEWRRLAPQGSTEGSLYTAPGYLELPVLQ